MDAGSNDKRRIAVRAVAFFNDKLLVVKHIGQNGQEMEYWATPGGRLEPQESITDCLGREMVEETAIPPKVGKLLFIQQFVNENGVEKIEFFFNIDNPQDYLTIDLSKTSHGLIEIAEISFQDINAIKLLPAFLTKDSIKQQIETDQPVRLFSSLN